MNTEDQENKMIKKFLGYLNTNEGTSFDYDPVKIDQSKVAGRVPDFQHSCKEMNIIVEITRATQGDDYAEKMKRAAELCEDIRDYFEGKVNGYYALDYHPGENLLKREQRRGVIEELKKEITGFSDSSPEIGAEKSIYLGNSKFRIMKINHVGSKVSCTDQFPASADSSTYTSAKYVTMTQIVEANEKFRNYHKTGFTNILLIDNCHQHWLPHSLRPETISVAIHKENVDTENIDRIFLFHRNEIFREIEFK